MPNDVIIALNRLLETDGIEGVEILARDGQCLHEVFRSDLDIPSYSAESAQLTATSEALLPQMRAAQNAHVISPVVDDRQVILVRTEQDLVLAALASSGHPKDLLGVLERAAPTLGRLASPHQPPGHPGH